MDRYREISYLLKKYEERQPNERWSKDSELKYYNMRMLNEQIRLFDLINSEYFRLVGSQRERAIYLIKVLNFNKFCPICTNEQMIVLICFYVKCEYISNYERRRCQRAFDDFNVTDNLLDKFMVHLANIHLKREEKLLGDYILHYTSEENKRDG